MGWDGIVTWWEDRGGGNVGWVGRVRVLGFWVMIWSFFGGFDSKLDFFSYLWLASYFFFSAESCMLFEFISDTLFTVTHLPLSHRAHRF